MKQGVIRQKESVRAKLKKNVQLVNNRSERRQSAEKKDRDTR